MSVAYRLRPRPGKELLAAALDAADDREFSLLWVTRPWSFDRYTIGTEATADVRHAHRAALAEYLRAQRRTLEERTTRGTSEVYLSIALPGVGPARGLEVERHLRQRLLPWQGCEHASEADLRWLTRRAGAGHQAFFRVTRPFGSPAPWTAIGDLLAPLEMVGHSVDIALTAAAGGNPAPKPLRFVLSVRACASSAGELERLIERLQVDLADARLRREAPGHLMLWLGHVEAKRVDATHASRATPTELGTMLPQPTPELGTEVGPYIGHRTNGSSREVRFDPAEASRGPSPWVLIAGAPGSGKTSLMQLVLHHAYLTGAVVCDVDLGGDHVVHGLTEESARVVDLTADPLMRGRLDPLRIVPPGLREDLACSVILDVLGGGLPAGWATAVRLAVQAVVARDGRSSDVIEELRRGREPGPQAAAALSERAGRGLGRLTFGREARDTPEPSLSQRIVLRVPPIVTTERTARAANNEDARLRRALAKLLALYALRLAGRDPRRRVVLGLDGAGNLLTDRTGEEVVRHVAHVGRARPITALLATRSLDGGEESARIGTVFCFRARSDSQASRSLRVLGLDESDAQRRRAMRSLEPGQCLMRDHAGRTGEVQIEVANPELAAALTGAPRMSTPRLLDVK